MRCVLCQTVVAKVPAAIEFTFEANLRAWQERVISTRIGKREANHFRTIPIRDSAINLLSFRKIGSVRIVWRWIRAQLTCVAHENDLTWELNYQSNENRPRKGTGHPKSSSCHRSTRDAILGPHLRAQNVLRIIGLVDCKRHDRAHARMCRETSGE